MSGVISYLKVENEVGKKKQNPITARNYSFNMKKREKKFETRISLVERTKRMEYGRKNGEEIMIQVDFSWNALSPGTVRYCPL